MHCIFRGFRPATETAGKIQGAEPATRTVGKDSRGQVKVEFP